MQEDGKGSEDSKKLKVYTALVAIAAVLAAISFLIVPQGNSIGSCDRLVFASSKYACVTGLALAQSNASICGYAGTSSDSCYMQVAEKTNDSATCSSIANATTMSLCVSTIASAENNYSLCSMAVEPYASSCEYGIALDVGNATLCTPISNYTYSVKCSSILGIKAAELSSNPAYCLNVSASENKTLSSYIISESAGAASYSAGNFLLSSLALIPNVTYTARDYCYINLAAKLSDPAICANVSAGEAASICTEEANAYNSTATANYTQLLDECSQAGSFAQECTQSVTLEQAIGTKNATLCTTLPFGSENECYSLLASTYKNSTYCSYIGNQTAKSSCVSGS